MNLRYSFPIAALAAAISTSAMAQAIGPSTTTEPYVLPTAPGVLTRSVLTVGDSVNGYRMAGVPDGLGVFLSSSATIDVVFNHEISRNAGIVRAHGSKGAFVSRWTIDSSGKVTAGRDHMTSPNNLFTFKNGAYAAGTSAIERLCSADLAPQSAYGVPDRIFLSGEETTPGFTPDHGRVFAHVLTGADANKTFELPHLGKMAFENALASPFAQGRTVVMLSDDANRETNVTLETVCSREGQTGCQEPSSELAMYIGDKRAAGNAIERAGLFGGKFYGVRVKLPDGSNLLGEHKDFALNKQAPAITTARFEPVPFPDVSNMTGVEIQGYMFAYQITQFIRIEDGAWDPRPGKERDYYFVTTGRITSDIGSWRPSRLWRLRFYDIAHPEWGGEIAMLLQNQFFAGANATPDADPSYQMFDNMTIDKYGRIILQEDVGGNNRLGRIYVYGIDSGNLVQVAAHNPKFFGGNAQTNPNFVTNDEESSGIVDASSIMGDGWYLFVSQSHKASRDPELVEGGQLLSIYIHPSIAVGGSSSGGSSLGR
ncbi:phytase [Methylocystis sp. S23]